MNFDLVGGRKFALAMFCQLSVNALVWAGKISDQVFATVVLATVGAYIVGNVVQRHVEKP